MTNFWKKAVRGYMGITEPVNECWSYLFRCEWLCSIGYTLRAIVLLVVLLLITPFSHLCVAPFVAFLEGMSEEE